MEMGGKLLRSTGSSFLRSVLLKQGARFKDFSIAAKFLVNHIKSILYQGEKKKAMLREVLVKTQLDFRGLLIKIKSKQTLPFIKTTSDSNEKFQRA